MKLKNPCCEEVCVWCRAGMNDLRDLARHIHRDNDGGLIAPGVADGGLGVVGSLLVRLGRGKAPLEADDDDDGRDDEQDEYADAQGRICAAGRLRCWCAVRRAIVYGTLLRCERCYASGCVGVKAMIWPFETPTSRSSKAHTRFSARSRSLAT